MFKKIIATAAVATLFACSSDAEPDDGSTPSSASVTTSSSSTGGGGGDGSSSSVEDGVSSSAALVFDMLYDFNGDEPLPPNIMGYIFGDDATCVADSLPELDDEGEPVLDGEGNEIKYPVWNPGGILTMKDFSFNGSSTTDGNNGGGLMIKEIALKDYAAFRFKYRGEMSNANRFRFRLKYELVTGESGAWALGITPSSDWQTIEIGVNEGAFSAVYNEANFSFEELLERGDILEFYMGGDGTLEIKDFEAALR